MLSAYGFHPRIREPIPHPTHHLGLQTTPKASVVSSWHVFLRVFSRSSSNGSARMPEYNARDRGNMSLVRIFRGTIQRTTGDMIVDDKFRNFQGTSALRRLSIENAGNKLTCIIARYGLSPYGVAIVYPHISACSRQYTVPGLSAMQP